MSRRVSWFEEFVFGVTVASFIVLMWPIENEHPHWGRYTNLAWWGSMVCFNMIMHTIFCPPTSEERK